MFILRGNLSENAHTQTPSRIRTGARPALLSLLLRSTARLWERAREKASSPFFFCFFFSGFFIFFFFFCPLLSAAVPAICLYRGHDARPRFSGTEISITVTATNNTAAATLLQEHGRRQITRGDAAGGGGVRICGRASGGGETRKQRLCEQNEFIGSLVP